MNIVFSGLNLNDAVNYWTEEIEHELTAKAEINLQKIARSNDSVILKKNYGAKIFKATIIIEDDSVSAMDSRLDTFKRIVEVKERSLDIDYAGGTRRYICTGFLESIDRKPRWARAVVRFECYKSFGEDTANTTEAFKGKTTSPYTDDVDIAGSAPAKPDITIKINTLTATGLKFIKLRNIDNGDYIQVSVDGFEADDIITINTSTSLVFVNGNITPYLGIMPQWNPGVNNWEYTDDFTARNVDITFAYKKRWL